MIKNPEEKAPTRRRVAVAVVLIAVAAVAMGIPTLRGTFVGGDDHRLVLNHVLVNRPSIPHALELFKIAHRDLYQPLPLLSFSAEFAVANAFGLFDKSIAGGAWLFHLTNTLLHALNAVLVWIVIKGVHRDAEGRSAHAVATVAAVLFAIHPLQVEVVAWVNGRMMLLSTLFALASLATLTRWLRDHQSRWAVLTVVFVICCAISKIRVALPLLLVIVLLGHRRRITRGFALLWLICTAITAGFALVNVGATTEAGMIAGAAQELHGSSVVRALLALAWYFQHLIWPTGLASWYPAPAEVHWSDPATVRAIAIVLLVLVVAGWSALRSRAAGLGFAWFFVTIASTVQLVPMRNSLAADRYMYLPIIGLLWFASLILVQAYAGAARRWTPGPVRAVAGPLAVLGIVATIALSWHVAWFYENPIRKSRRIAELFPATPHVWARTAWAHHEAGRFEEAITLAEREYEHDDKCARSSAHQVIGVAQFRLGDHDTAFASLQRAIDTDPANSPAKYDLAKILEEVGRLEEARHWYEESIADAPMANPRIIRLAALYRQLQRPTDARRLYEQALKNNPYDVPATMGLAELDIARGTLDAYQAAERRLAALLREVPDYVDAWVNLGVIRSAMGRTGAAIDAYRTALENNPRHATAALNLAVLYQSQGDVPRAGPLFELAAEIGLESVEQAIVVHDFFVEQRAANRAVALWVEFLRRFPNSPEARAFAAWSRVQAGDIKTAIAEAGVLTESDPPQPMALATLAFAALAEGRYGAAMKWTDAFCRPGAADAETRGRLLRALEFFDQQRPGIPWTYCMVAEVLIADGQMEGAQAFADLCAQHCQEPACRVRVQSLRARLPARPREATEAAPAGL